MVADRTAYILDTLGHDDHTIDLALTASWMHDLGNVINRVDHSQSGALILADKSDVRRSRVQDEDERNYDIHGTYVTVSKSCRISKS